MRPSLTRLFLFATLAGTMTLTVGCSDDDPPESCEVGCPCASIVDCPDPINQVCDQNFTCQPRDGGDTGTDADPDTEIDAGDMGTDAGSDVGEDAPDDTPRDTLGDTPEDGGDTPVDAPGDGGGDTPDGEDSGEDSGGDVRDTDPDAPEDGGPDAESDVDDDVVDPPVSVTNPWVVFTAPDASFLDKIFMVRATGTDLIQIETGDIVQYDPTLQPFGTLLAYRAIGPGIPLVKTVDLLTGEVTTIDHGLASLGSLGWAPDGSEIICEGRRSVDGSNDLFRIPLDGSGAVAIGETAGRTEAAPVWFSDNRIYFVSDVDGIFEVWRRNVDTLEDDQVTFGALIIGAASVSWDENVLAYVQRTGVDTGQLNLHDLVRGSFAPVGSPTASGPFLTSDGNMLGYIDNVGGGNREIVLSNLLGVTLNVVTSSPAPEANLEIGRVESSSFPLWLLAD